MATKKSIGMLQNIAISYANKELDILFSEYNRDFAAEPDAKKRAVISGIYSDKKAIIEGDKEADIAFFNELLATFEAISELEKLESLREYFRKKKVYFLNNLDIAENAGCDDLMKPFIFMYGLKWFREIKQNSDDYLFKLMGMANFEQELEELEEAGKMAKQKSNRLNKKPGF